MQRTWMGLVLGLVFVSGLGSPVAVQADDPAEKVVSPLPEETDENAALPAGTPTYELRYQFVAGSFTHFKVSDRSSMTTRKDSAVGTVHNVSQMWRHYRVVNVDADGTATLELMIDRVRMSNQFDDAEPTIFDSADRTLQPAKFQAILASVGKPMNRIKVTSRGKMLSLRSLQGEPSRKNDPSENFLIVFPEHPVAVGQNWKQTLEVEVPVTDRLKEDVKLLRTYTLKSVADDVATIELNTVLVTRIRDPAVRTRLLQQTPKGVIRFDLANGQLLYRESTTAGQVFGPYGTGSSVESKSVRTETLIPAESKTPQPADGQPVTQQASGPAATIEK